MGVRRNGQRKSQTGRYVLRDGKLVRLSKVRAQQKVAGGHSPACWPMKVRVCGSKQRKKFAKALAKKGVSVDIDARGYVTVSDRNHYKRLNEARGIIDFNSGFSGDARPNEMHYEMQREAEREQRTNRKRKRSFAISNRV